MLYSSHTTLADKVTELLIRKPRSIKGLHQELSASEEVSLRAVYKTVDQLVLARVLVKAGKNVHVDEEWVRKVRQKFSSQLPLLVGPGERIVHSFTSISHLDAFWTTIALQLEALEKDGQVFFYNPHNFWAYIPERKESEDAYYAHFSESKLHAFFTLGGETVADRECKRTYQDEYLQIDTRIIPSFSRTDHITVMGDHVITVRISRKAAAEIDGLYASEKPIAELLPALTESYNQDFPSRFVLENNPKKAEKLRALLARNFYLHRY